MEKKYTSFKSISAGADSSYSIKDENGNKSALGFDSKAEADHYIKTRLENNQDPMTLSTDFEKMSKALNQ